MRRTTVVAGNFESIKQKNICMSFFYLPASNLFTVAFKVEIYVVFFFFYYYLLGLDFEFCK